MSLKPVKDTHGRVVAVEFKPTMKMLRVVLAFNKAENSGKSNQDIIEACGVNPAEFSSWHNDYIIRDYDKEGNLKSARNYFKEWLDEALEIKSGEERAILRLVGMQKAIGGDFQFWKEMSRTHGAITQETVEHNHHIIPFNLGKDNATIEDLQSAKKKLMDAHRGVGNDGGTGMARLTTKRSKS